MGTAERALRMIQLAGQFCEPRDIHYTGIDLFEGRSEADGPGLSLKAAHCRLTATGARIRLVPGTPVEAFSRVANSLGTVDILLLSPRPDLQPLDNAWLFIPRLLHGQSQVFLETPSSGRGTSIRLLDLDEIGQRAGAIRRAA